MVAALSTKIATAAAAAGSRRICPLQVAFIAKPPSSPFLPFETIPLPRSRRLQCADPVGGCKPGSSLAGVAAAI
jgi:hypothetical protein